MSGLTKKYPDSSTDGLSERVNDLRSIYCSIPESDEQMRFGLVVKMLEMASADFVHRKVTSRSQSLFYRHLIRALEELRLET